MTKTLAISAAALIGMLGLILAVLVYQGAQTSKAQPEYVALGSSFAAGADLGPLQPASPLLCARSINGYPQQLARLRHLSLVDMSCGGAVTPNLHKGGQFFQGPQVRVISPATRLVTITAGGNDIGYIGDLSLLAARKDHSFFGWLVRTFWKGPKAADQRNYDAVRVALLATLQSIHRRAPAATVVVATYPSILPLTGTCARLQLSADEAALMRQVAGRLAQVTRSAAIEGGATVVDMNGLGSAHDACSTSPWTRGWIGAGAAPFHPTLEGARATAGAISGALGT